MILALYKHTPEYDFVTMPDAVARSLKLDHVQYMLNDLSGQVLYRLITNVTTEVPMRAPSLWEFCYGKFGYPADIHLFRHALRHSKELRSYMLQQWEIASFDHISASRSVLLIKFSEELQESKHA